MFPMNMKTGLTGLGLFVVAGLLSISCGGTSDTGDSPTAGKGSGGSSAGSTTGGSPSAGGKNSAGTTSGGTNPSNGGTGPGPGGGGDGPGPGPGGGGDGPIGNNGGAGNNPACPAAQPTDGEMCTVMTGFQGCDYGALNCRCRAMGGGQNAMRAWDCNEEGGGFGGFPNVGQGGDGSIGDVVCPEARPQTDDVCTGTGFCPYQGGGCVCDGTMFTCFGGNN